MTVTSWTLRLALPVWAALACSASPAQPRTDGIAPYRAVYTLLNGNDAVGKSVFTLQYDADSGRYEFETRSEFRALLLRLAAPRPVVEHSEFTVVDGEICPLAFDYEDGTRGGRRNVRLRFDWPTGRLIAEGRDGREDLPLPPSTLDRASARIALMRDLATSTHAGSYRIADPVEIQTYEFHDEGLEAIVTAAGRFDARKVVQQRPGSSRRTLIWAAPALEFLAVRIEQRRDGRKPVAFELESVEWLAPDVAAAGGRPGGVAE